VGRADYWAIREGIKEVLEADTSLAGATFLIEAEVLFSPERCPYGIVYLNRRTAQPGEQRISAGTRIDFTSHFSIWCAHYSFESLPKAVELRDDFIGTVEVALMKNRTLNGTVRDSWLDGGDFFDTADEKSFIAIGEIRLVAKHIATTT